METVHIRAKECHANVIEVDEKSAQVMIDRGTWELVEEEGTDNGRRNTGRRGRTAGSNSSS
jgi:hypothetical protein